MQRFFTTTISFLLAIVSLHAQPGANDPTFNPTDAGFAFGEKANGTVAAIARQADGKLVMVGDFTTYDGISRKGIARVNHDGTLDETFEPGNGLGGLQFSELVITSDQKILVGGILGSYDEHDVSGIARVNTDGSYDDSFKSVVNFGIVYAIRPLPDGKILVAGGIEGRIARLNQDGTRDTSFESGLGANQHIRDIALDGDKIYIGGEFTSYDGVLRNRIARLNANGKIDTSFDPGTGANDRVATIAIQSDKKILVGGKFTNLNSIQATYVGRLNVDGSVDQAFDAPGFNYTVQRVLALSGNKVLVVGWSFDSGAMDPGLTRLTSTGERDADFLRGQNFPNQALYDAIEEPSGHIVAVGQSPLLYFGEVRNGIVRINLNGTAESSFVPAGTGANSNVSLMALQADGKLIIAGAFTYYNGVARNHIARLKADGTLDETFSANGPNGEIHALVVQADGKIIVTGNFSEFNGSAHNRIVRLNPSGTVDDTFTPPAFSSAYSTYSTIRAVALQPDQKIILGSSFSMDGQAFMVRLNSDGSIDNTFSTSAAFSHEVACVSVLGSGKILVGGSFITYGQTSRRGIARLNEDGSLDTSFDPGTGFNSGLGVTPTYSIDVQGDGKVLVAGDFYSFNGVNKKGIVRLNENGSLDATFTGLQNGYDYSVRSVNVVADGKIILGGYFNYYGDKSRLGLVRVNTDGTLDTSFTVGTGFSSTFFDGPVLTTLVLNDGKIMVGGNFISFAGVGRNRMARVLIDCQASITMDKPQIDAEAFTCAGVGATLSVAGNILPHGAEWSWYTGSCGGDLVATGETLPVLDAAKKYYVKATGGCVSIATCAEINVTLKQLPTIAIPQNVSRCGEGTAVLKAVPSAGTIDWYAISFGGDLIATGTEFTTPSLTENATYYAEAVDGGCHSAVRWGINVTISNTVPAAPTVTEGSRCGEGKISLSANTSGGTINWYPSSDAVDALKTNNTIFETPPISATTTYYAEADNGCKSSRVAVVATIKPNPVVTVEADGATLTATVASPAGTATYQWVSCTGPLSGNVTSASYNASVNLFDGAYAVNVTVNGCTTKSECITIVGLEDLAGSFRLFPNPAKGVFFVELVGEGAKNIRLTDASGRTVYETTTSATGLFEINTPNKVGIYILSIKNRTGVGHSKVVLE